MVRCASWGSPNGCVWSARTSPARCRRSSDGGLVRRVAHPYDRRASLIELTEQGASATGRYSASIIGWFTDAVADWSDQDRNELGRLAKDVIARLTRLDDGS
jgi:DNA-binding MarR family transcriptional regulator